MFNRFTAFRFLRRYGHHPLLWLGLPLTIYLWAIPGPFVFDDLNLALKTEDYIEGVRDRLDLFRFAPTRDDWMAMRSRGTYPWWSPPERRIDFFRPLAERSFWLDMRLFGRNPVWPRIESLLLFAIVLILVNRLYRTVELDATRAGVATALLGVSQCLALPVVFLSNRSDLFVLIGVSLTTIAYLRRESSREALWFVIGIFGLVFALASKEPAVAVAGVIAAHWFFVRFVGDREKGAPRRTAFVLTVFLIAAAYLTWYFSTRFGVVTNGADHANQLNSIINKLKRLLLYGSVWFGGVPIHALPNLGKSITPLVVGIGFVGWLAIAWIAIRQLREGRPGTRFFSLWIAAFLLPALLTIPEPRALSIATVGWAYLLVGFLMPYVPPVDDRKLIWTRQWFLAVNGIVSVCCGIGTILVMNGEERAARNRIDRISKIVAPPLHDGDTLMILAAESPYELICAGGRLAWMTGLNDVSTIYLSLANADATIEAEADGAWLVRGTAPYLLDSPTHRLTLGADYAPRIGDRFELNQMTVTIAELDEQGRVTSLRVDLNPKFDPSRLRLYAE